MNTLHSLFDWTLDASLRASLLTVGVLLLQLALGKRLPARWRYALWLPVLVVLIMPMLPQSRWSAENLVTSPVAESVRMTGVLTPASSPAVMEPPKPATFDWKATAAILWAAGALGLLVGSLICHRSELRRFQRSSTPPEPSLMTPIKALCAEMSVRPPHVLVSSQVASPAVAGVLSPVLLLPAGFLASFSSAEAMLVLKHELMHLKRRDLEVNTLTCFIHALHWFNPLIWLAVARSRQDREAACDAQVLASDSRDCRRDYGHALLKVQSIYAPRGFSMGFVGIFEQGKALRSRITAIAHYRTAHPVTGFVAAVLIAGLAVLGATRAQQPATNEAAKSRAPTPTATPASGAMLSLPDRLQNIVIPHLKFQDAKLSEVIEFFQKIGRDRGPGEKVNILARFDRIAGDTQVSFGFENISLGDALRHFGQIADLSVKVESYAVVIAANPVTGSQGLSGKEATRAAAITVPSVEFANATLVEAVEFFQVKALALDPEKKGINLQIAAGTKSEAPITLSLKDVPLLEALRYVSQLAHVRLQGGEDMILFVSPKADK